MSTATSPAHRISGDYDGYYDPRFTAEISNKMQVPSSIRLDDGDIQFDRGSGDYYMSDDHAFNMQVPDRIIVAGQEHHVGARAPPRELRLEQTMAPQPQSVHVQTPPRVITLDEHRFPTVDDNAHNARKKEHDKFNSLVLSDQNRLSNSGDSSMIESPQSEAPASPTEEVHMIRRQMSKLSRRVLILEQENAMRQQREVILVSLGGTYFLLKVLAWLNRHW